MSIKATLFSHFYNEEYLLPWWLKHHTKMFDHGILINRNSTDRSVAICREYAPHWEVRDAHVKMFDAVGNDQEIMDLEAGVNGWKIALTITEFFCCRYFKQYLKTLESSEELMFQVPSFAIVDDPSVHYNDPHPDQPLVDQRHYGYREEAFHNRFIHKHSDGAYLPGRHLSQHRSVRAPQGALIKWFGFSPWNDAMRKRKLQVQLAIPESDRALGRGFQHIIDGPGLEELYLENTKRSGDLFLNSNYREVFSR